MFFTRRERDKVAELERRIEVYEAKLSLVLGLHESLHTAHLSALDAFKTLASQYSDGLERARKIQEEAEAAIQNPAWAGQPLYTTEEEEDLRFHLDSGALDPAEFHEALRQAGIPTD